MLDEKEFYRYHGLFHVSGLGPLKGTVYVAKKVYCKSLHTKEKFRVVFQVFEGTIRILEVYYKNDKEMEDIGRIRNYCQN